jgi:hypothetical protein
MQQELLRKCPQGPQSRKRQRRALYFDENSGIHPRKKAAEILRISLALTPPALPAVALALTLPLALQMRITARRCQTA